MNKQEKYIKLLESQGWTQVRMNYNTYNGGPFDYLEGIPPNSPIHWIAPRSPFEDLNECQKIWETFNEI